PREAGMMDPQQRIFLETVWKAIEDSGQKVSDLSGSRTGLFVGVATNDYTDVLRDRHAALDGYSASGNSHSVLANRVSFMLNLHGPSAPIDTACSSSLVALHRAIESIHTGSCDMAIVGGVQVNLSPGAFISFGSAGMLSPDGKCKTFDKRANGYVRGEGSGAIFIKRLRDAEADGNHIYAVIRATAENHGGKVTTLTAPNASAQTALLIDAYEKARIDPTTVGYIECHGTGTSLGDPIEIQALTKAFAELYKKHGKPPAATPHCGLSSVKTNIGHLETAAGIASILKALLALQHKLIPANIHFEEINPFINLKGTPFYIVDKPTPWEAPRGADGAPVPRRVGVSSFGFGGANAHIVLEEYIPRESQAPAAVVEPRLIVLSAKNDDRLRAYVESMLTFLRKRDVDPADLAYTLQAGRDEMQERLALVVSTTEELERRFEEILAGEKPEGCYRNSIRGKAAPMSPEMEALVRAAVEKRDLARLGELWVSGAKIDWRALYGAARPRRISMPPYPFARERHWIPQGTADVSIDRAHAEESTARLHPLVHRNVSTLREQKFASRFDGAEFFFDDHRVQNERVLPGVAYIEMIAAAGEQGGEQKVRAIRNLVWLTPITVGDAPRDVEVALAPGKGEIEVLVRSVDGDRLMTHCRGRVLYTEAAAAQSVLSIAEIEERCQEETISAGDFYPFLFTSDLKLGKSFQVVQSVHAGRSESLAVLKLPEHLQAEADRYWLHPALLDGAVHTAIGMVKKRKPAMPWSVPYSVAEVRIYGSLKDVQYAHAVWDLDSTKDDSGLTKIQIHLLGRDGRVLVRMKDFATKAFRQPSMPIPAPAPAPAEVVPAKPPEVQKDEPIVRSLVPVWNAVRPASIEAADSTRVLLLGGDATALEWIARSYPEARQIVLPSSAAADIDEAFDKGLAGHSFDELLWIAPDVAATPATGVSEQQQGGALSLFGKVKALWRHGPASKTPRRIPDVTATRAAGVTEQQQDGVLSLFRMVKALLRHGYASKTLRWTIVTRNTQRVTERDSVQPAHAAIFGFAGSLAKEYPQWDLRLLDLDSLDSVSVRECLGLPS
ncbi:MAG TPA: type I polyketide synthase, partial [Thermoanaerobaculia bacterium]|nr:type I polyketide synthase [Thermoanaerobaculia bacterium]